MMNEKIDKLESRIFDLELSNDKLKQENDIMKNHISRQEDRMDGLEDGLNPYASRRKMIWNGTHAKAVLELLV